MNNDHVHTATAKLKTSNINFASFFAKPPNKIPAIFPAPCPYTYFILFISIIQVHLKWRYSANMSFALFIFNHMLESQKKSLISNAMHLYVPSSFHHITALSELGI